MKSKTPQWGFMIGIKLCVFHKHQTYGEINTSVKDSRSGGQIRILTIKNVSVTGADSFNSAPFGPIPSPLRFPSE